MLTNRLPLKYRSAVRFLIIGTIGTAVQYGLYWVLLWVTDRWWPEAALATACFTLAYAVEMTMNYFLTTWYTFSSRPSLKNAGGFVSGRVANYFIQIVLLQGFIWLGQTEQVAGILSIVVAGVINYFIVKLSFKQPH